MSLRSHQPRKGCPGFTLVELLVSLAILLLILGVCAALTLTAENLLSNGTERIDADSQARLFFDRITIDLEAMVKRTDVDCIVKNSTQVQTGNDSMAFFARGPGYFSSSPDPAPRKSLSVLGYRINSQTYQLERLAKGTGWNTTSSGTPMVFQTSPPQNPGMQLYSTWPLIAGLTGGIPNLNVGTDPDYQVLADSVFRFEYCYILRDGSFSNLPWLTADQSKGLNGWQDVVALYVAIAVLDNRSRQAISNGGSTNPNLAAATSKLTDFPLDATQTYPPLSQWETIVNQSNFAAVANLPPKVAQSVRVYARSIPINLLPPDTTL